MQRFLKTAETLSCWYVLDSCRQVLSDEYSCARVSVIFQFFASICIGQISHKGFKPKVPLEKRPLDLDLMLMNIIRQLTLLLLRLLLSEKYLQNIFKIS